MKNLEEAKSQEAKSEYETIHLRLTLEHHVKDALEVMGGRKVRS